MPNGQLVTISTDNKEKLEKTRDKNLPLPALEETFTL
jgi:hypothetical protein